MKGGMELRTNEGLEASGTGAMERTELFTVSVVEDIPESSSMWNGRTSIHTQVTHSPVYPAESVPNTDRQDSPETLCDTIKIENMPERCVHCAKRYEEDRVFRKYVVDTVETRRECPSTSGSSGSDNGQERLEMNTDFKEEIEMQEAVIRRSIGIGTSDVVGDDFNTNVYNNRVIKQELAQNRFQDKTSNNRKIGVNKTKGSLGFLSADVGNGSITKPSDEVLPGCGRPRPCIEPHLNGGNRHSSHNHPSTKSDTCLRDTLCSDGQGISMEANLGVNPRDDEHGSPVESYSDLAPGSEDRSSPEEPSLGDNSHCSPVKSYPVINSDNDTQNSQVTPPIGLNPNSLEHCSQVEPYFGVNPSSDRNRATSEPCHGIKPGDPEQSSARKINPQEDKDRAEDDSNIIESGSCLDDEATEEYDSWEEEAINSRASPRNTRAVSNLRRELDDPKDECVRQSTTRNTPRKQAKQTEICDASYGGGDSKGRAKDKASGDRSKQTMNVKGRKHRYSSKKFGQKVSKKHPVKKSTTFSAIDTFRLLNSPSWQPKVRIGRVAIPTLQTKTYDIQEKHNDPDTTANRYCSPNTEQRMNNEKDIIKEKNISEWMRLGPDLGGLGISQRTKLNTINRSRSKSKLNAFARLKGSHNLLVCEISDDVIKAESQNMPKFANKEKERKGRGLSNELMNTANVAKKTTPPKHPTLPDEVALTIGTELRCSVQLSKNWDSLSPKKIQSHSVPRTSDLSYHVSKRPVLTLDRKRPRSTTVKAQRFFQKRSASIKGINISKTVAHGQQTIKANPLEPKESQSHSSSDRADQSVQVSIRPVAAQGRKKPRTQTVKKQISYQKGPESWKALNRSKTAANIPQTNKGDSLPPKDIQSHSSCQADLSDHVSMRPVIAQTGQKNKTSPVTKHMSDQNRSESSKSFSTPSPAAIVKQTNNGNSLPPKEIQSNLSSSRTDPSDHVPIRPVIAQTGQQKKTSSAKDSISDENRSESRKALNTHRTEVNVQLSRNENSYPPEEIHSNSSSRAPYPGDHVAVRPVVGQTKKKSKISTGIKQKSDQEMSESRKTLNTKMAAAKKRHCDTGKLVSNRHITDHLSKTALRTSGSGGKRVTIRRTTEERDAAKMATSFFKAPPLLHRDRKIGGRHGHKRHRSSQSERINVSGTAIKKKRVECAIDSGHSSAPAPKELDLVLPPVLAKVIVSESPADGAQSSKEMDNGSQHINKKKRITEKSSIDNNMTATIEPQQSGEKRVCAEKQRNRRMKKRKANREFALNYFDKSRSTTPRSSSTTDSSIESAHDKSSVDVRLYACRICQKAFNNKWRMRVHEREVHTPGRPFRCGVCGAQMKRKSSLNKHMLAHTRGAVFKCDQCDRRFTRRDYLTRHLLTHVTERNFKCVTCARGFVRAVDLKKHAERMHQFHPGCKCSTCKKTFPTRYDAKIHRAQHLVKKKDKENREKNKENEKEVEERQLQVPATRVQLVEKGKTDDDDAQPKSHHDGQDQPASPSRTKEVIKQSSVMPAERGEHEEISDKVDNQASTEVSSRIPEVSSRIPEVSSRETEVSPRIPEVISRVPEVSSRMTKVSSRMTKVSSRMTKVSPRTTEVSPRTTEVSPRIPEVISRVTEVSSRVTEVSSRMTKVSSRIPEVSSRMTEVSPRKTEVSPRIPKVISRVTEVSSRETEVSSEIPEVSSCMTEVSPRITKVSSRMTEVSSRMTKVSPRTTEVSPRTTEVSPRIPEVISRVTEVSSQIPEVSSRTKVLTIRCHDVMLEMGAISQGQHFLCKRCEKRFDTVFGLKNHRQTEPQCGKTNAQDSTLNRQTEPQCVKTNPQDQPLNRQTEPQCGTTNAQDSALNRQTEPQCGNTNPQDSTLNRQTEPRCEQGKTDRFPCAKSDNTYAHDTIRHSQREPRCQQGKSDRPSCDKSDKTSPNNTTLRRKKKPRCKQGKTERFPCDKCEKTYAHERTLKQHKRVHLISKRRLLFKCGECNKAFPDSSKLIKHVRIHTDEMPSSRVSRSKSFRSSARLSNPINSHTREPLFKCEKCDRTFKTSDKLVKHTRMHAGNGPYPCPHCSKKFRISASLSKHITIHTGETPYKCKDCRQSFRLPTTLLSHQVSAHGAPHRYKCETCGRGFLRLYRLTDHKRIHTGEKPFECQKCNKFFRTSRLLDKHLNSHIHKQM